MNRSLLLLCVGVSSGLTTFAAVDVAKLPAASARKGLTYATDIKPLFEASCTRCHGEERQRGGLRLDSLQAVMAGGENGKILTPGKGAESGLVHAVSQLDDETAMPPKRGGGGRGGPGGQGGPGGPGGGRGGFGPGGLLATQMMSQGDSNTDKKLSQDEFGKLAESWYAKLDAGKTGKLTQEQFVEKLGEVLPMPQRGGGGGNGGPGGGGGGGRGGGPARFLGPGLFGATDTDKDGSLTLSEWKGTFSGWFSKWDADKAGALSEEQVRTGLSAALPAPQFGGRRGGGQGGGGQGGPGGPGGGGGGGGQNKPLTAEEVGLVRAWIDQGAK